MSGHGDSPFADGLLPGGRKHDDAEFDITAMIDLVFLMNIYFMFLFITNAASQTSELPSAVHAAPLNMDEAIVIEVLAGNTPTEVVVKLAGEDEIRDPATQEAKITEAVDHAVRENKTKILLKCQKSVRCRETKRIAGAAGREGVTLHVAVMEMNDQEGGH